jgi:hypothetical protein
MQQYSQSRMRLARLEVQYIDASHRWQEHSADLQHYVTERSLERLKYEKSWHPMQMEAWRAHVSNVIREKQALVNDCYQKMEMIDATVQEIQRQEQSTMHAALPPKKRFSKDRNK